MALYFLSGKGGTGKTHLSTSLSVFLSERGRRVLLVEFSKFAQYSEYFQKKISFEPSLIQKNFYAASWTGLDCLHEYASRVLRSQKAAEFFFKVPLMAKLSKVAPGLKEIAVLGKITSDYRDNDFKTDFDDVVFDCPASGHFLSMMKVPKALGAIVGTGPMRRQCESIQKTLVEHPDVYFGLVDNGAKFSEIEIEETRTELGELLKSKEIKIIKNCSEMFPYIREESWILSAKKNAPRWGAFKWK